MSIIGGIFMSELADALIVIDMQEALQYSYNFDQLTKNINDRINIYHQKQLPIIFIQHNDQDLIRGSDLWKLTSKLDKQENDLVIEKFYPNAFYKTDLNKILQKKNIEEIEVCGVQTEYCCNTTIIVAHSLGYQVVMKHDLTTTFDNDYMTAENTISFFEHIWEKHFLTFI